MEHLALVDAVDRERATIAAVLRGSEPGTDVPTCPGWQLRDLALHVGEFLGFWAHVLCDATGAAKPAYGEPDGNGADWLDAVGDDISTRLRSLPGDATVWTWVPEDQSAHFVANRAAHELAIHRCDAQLAIGEPEPIERAVAGAGIDEVAMMVTHLSRATGAGETLHLHATDGAGGAGDGGEWMFTLGQDGVVVTREHGKGDLAIRATASDLELILYGRPTLDEVVTFGDPAVLATWYRIFRFGA